MNPQGFEEQGEKNLADKFVGEGEKDDAVPNDKITDIIELKVTDLFDELQNKRKEDEKLLMEFKLDLETFVETLCNDIRSKLKERYEESDAVLKDKVMELPPVVDRINNLEKELGQFHQAISSFFNNLQNLQ